MEIILKQLHFETEPCVVVFGNFDGVHKGHQLLIAKALAKGKELGIKTALFTFRPHPTFVVMGKDEKDIIFSQQEKQKVVEDLGIDYYIEYPFTMKIASMAAEDFVETVIYNQLHAQCVIVGEDFRFGRKRSGDVALLSELSRQYGYEVMAMKKLCDHERCVSSTWLREVVKKGDMEMYRELTGRYFSVMGIVEHGRAIGRTIGFPTANVMTHKSKILPPNGVYASYAKIDGEVYKSITNVGRKPDSLEGEMLVETYILDFEQMIYDETIEVDLLHFLRGEKVLESLDHLKDLIHNDLESLKAFLALNE